MIHVFFKLFKKSSLTPLEAACRQIEIEKLIEENRTKCLQLKTWL